MGYEGCTPAASVEPSRERCSVTVIGSTMVSGREVRGSTRGAAVQARSWPEATDDTVAALSWVAVSHRQARLGEFLRYVVPARLVETLSVQQQHGPPAVTETRPGEAASVLDLQGP